MTSLKENIIATFKKEFARLPKNIASLTAVGLVLALVYEIGFFSVFDINFITALGPTDYLRECIIWLPYTIPLLVSNVFTDGITWIEHSRGLKLRYQMFLVFMALFPFILYSFMWYSNNGEAYFYHITAGLSLIAVFALIDMKLHIATPKSATLIITLAMLLSCYLAGQLSALNHIKRPQNVLIINLDDENITTDLLRIADKGLLIYRKDTGVQLIPWGKIVNIKSPSSKNKSNSLGVIFYNYLFSDKPPII